MLYNFTLIQQFSSFTLKLFRIYPFRIKKNTTVTSTKKTRRDIQTSLYKVQNKNMDSMVSCCIVTDPVP